MISDLSVIKQVLNRNKSNLAFIVGNGINRFAYAQNQDVSWNALLLDVWQQISNRTLSNISDGISLTEFYDIMEFDCLNLKRFEVSVKTLQVVDIVLIKKKSSTLTIRFSPFPCITLPL